MIFSALGLGALVSPMAEMLAYSRLPVIPICIFSLSEIVGNKTLNLSLLLKHSDFVESQIPHKSLTYELIKPKAEK